METSAFPSSTPLVTTSTGMRVHRRGGYLSIRLNPLSVCLFFSFIFVHPVAHNWYLHFFGHHTACQRHLSSQRLPTSNRQPCERRRGEGSQGEPSRYVSCWFTRLPFLSF